MTSLGKMFEGESGLHIDEAVHQLKANGMDETPFPTRIQEFQDKALKHLSTEGTCAIIFVALWFWTQDLHHHYCCDPTPSLSYHVTLLSL